MRIVLAAGLIAASLAGAASAQQTPPDAPPLAAQRPARGGGEGMGGMGMAMFRMADTNHDGVVTREEYLAAVDSRFDREDLNRDGVLQASERPAPRPGAAMDIRRGGPPAGMQSGMARVPAPGTDAPPPPKRAMRDITRAEYRAAALRRFDRLDANHDGKVDQNEMQSAAMMMQFRGAGRRAPPAGGPDMPPPPGGPNMPSPPPPPGAQ